jgi:hypothetical protein
VQQAIALTVLDHPMLQASVTGEDSKQPHWTKTERIDLRERIKWTTIDTSSNDEAALIDVLKMQHDTPFSGQDIRPPWRITVLKYNDAPTTIDIFMA